MSAALGLITSMEKSLMDMAFPCATSKPLPSCCQTTAKPPPELPQTRIG